MVQARSVSRSISGSPYASGRPIVRDMAKPPKSSKAPIASTPDQTPDAEIDPHLREIAKRVDELREKRGMSRNKLAAESGIHNTHMGQFLLGRQGISLEVLSRAAKAVGAILLTEADEARPTRIGSVAPDGRLMTDIDTIVLPGFVEVPEGWAGFGAGEQVYVRADNAFELGKWVIVERRVDSTRHFVKCVDIDGVRHLLTPQGDEWRFHADRYLVVAKAYGGFRPM